MSLSQGMEISKASLTDVLARGIGSLDMCAKYCGMLHSLDAQRCYEYWVSVGLPCDAGYSVCTAGPAARNTTHSPKK